MHRMQCAEIWGGIRNLDSDVCSAGITASVYSGSCEGGSGGDIYYLSVCGSDMLTRIAIADVVGHGQAVSDVSTWLYDALRARMNDIAGDRVLADLNDLTCERGFNAITTAAVVAYYTADANAYFSYAGHHAALLRRDADGEWTAVKFEQSGEGLANLPLGVDPEVAYSQNAIPLRPADRLFLYTDGVIEAPNAGGEQFGEARLLTILRYAGGAALAETKNAVLRAVREHVGGGLTHDDVTMIAIEVN